MLPWVGLALAVQEKMEMADAAGKGIVMRFCKLYPPEKIAVIVKEAQSYPWWRSNPKAAFMKAVGVINKEEKEAYGA